MTRRLVLLLIACVLAVLAWTAATARPNNFILAVEPGGRLKYLWWDEIGRHYLGEVRHTACAGGTLRVEHWLETGWGWQFWGTYFVTSPSPVLEEDDLPRLERASDTCILIVINGAYYRKAPAREFFLPLFLDHSPVHPAYPYPLP